jgi:site-specific DNA recombinase
MKKVIGYVRVSTEEQVKHGNSIEIQTQRIEAYCLAKGWELIDIVFDPAESGASMEKRKEFTEKIRNRVGKGDFEAVVCIKLDRLSRNLKELLNFVEDELEPVGCMLASIDDPIDVSTPQGKLFFQMLGGFAEFERKLITQRTMDGITHRAKEGKHASGNVPTGYKSVEVNGKKELRIDEDSDGIEVVKLVFKLRDQDGLTYRAIAQYLNDQTDYLPKNWKPEKPTRFHDSSARAIYNNQKYKGVYVFNRRGEDTIVVPNKELQIV